LLLQLPIISGLYTAIRVSEPIASSEFFGISLGESHMVLAIITIVMYLIQSFITLQGVPEEQKAQMRSTLFMTPIMMGFIVFTTPAGLTLYFLAGAIWSILQSLFTTFYFKPRIQAEVDKEMAENPIKVKKPSSGRKDVTDSVKKEPTNKRLTNNDSQTNRNAGKQRK
ncbi:MAG: YidC/Oxa1 family membrane protein insertase, partial [Aerococcus urinaeequi]